jgi:hypothetical protein
MKRSIKYYQNVHFKENKMGGACRAHGEMINAYKILVVKPEGKRLFGRSKRSGKIILKCFFGKLGWSMIIKPHNCQCPTKICFSNSVKLYLK